MRSMLSAFLIRTQMFGANLFQLGTTCHCCSIRQIQSRSVAPDTRWNLQFHSLISILFPFRGHPIVKELKTRHCFEVPPRDNEVL